MNNPLATKDLSLFLLHVWRFSDTGSDHITHCNSRRHTRELLKECLVHLADRILKPGGGCIFGVTLPGGSLGKSLKVTPLCCSNKGVWPLGPTYAKLCYSQSENVHLLAFQRAGGKWEMWQHFLPWQGTTNVSNPTFTAWPEWRRHRTSLWLLLHCVWDPGFLLRKTFIDPHFEPVNPSSERRYYNDADTWGVRNSQRFAQRVTKDEKGVGKQSCLISETDIIALKEWPWTKHHFYPIVWSHPVSVQLLLCHLSVYCHLLCLLSPVWPQVPCPL